MKGKIVLYCSIAIVVLLWIIPYNFENNLFLTISRISALIGVILISWEFILSSRSFVIEELFNGLDKVYTFHHNVGRWGFILITLHPLMLIIYAILKNLNPFLYIIPVGPLAYNLGIYSLYLFIILLVVTIFIKIEYNLWKLTHNLMGIPLLFLSFHVILVSSDISANIPLRVVVISFIVLAVISFIYRRLFYHIFKVHEYKVSELKEHGNIIEVVLVPIGKILDFKPTQFVFVEFINNKISRELHPFTIANKNDGGSLSFFIKKLGDYTQGINKLQIGDRVKLYGPHGRFYTHFHYDKEIWVAGGIGITPFLAKLQELSENKGDVKDKQIILYYIAKTNQELIQTEKLLKYKETIPNFDVILHDTQELGRFDPKIIISKGNVGYLFCASEKLISNFKKVLLENKVKENNIHTELFKLY